MDASRPELPDLALQDGDSITVPSKPSFVAVFGAVLAEWCPTNEMIKLS
jgi:hypothetical protein